MNKFYPLLVSAFCFFTSSLIAQPFEFSLGDKTSQHDFEKILQAAPRATRDLLNLPSSYSLKKYAPEVKTQGKYSTCVAWSSAYAARSISYAIQRNFTHPDSINKYTFSPGHLYSKIKDPNDYNCDRGSSTYDAMRIMRDQGVLLKAENIADCVPFNSIGKPGDYRIKDFLALSSYVNITKADLFKIKKSLTENKPVVLSMKVYKSFYYVPNGIWTPTFNDPFLGNHAMCIVGYDDTRNGGSFEVMNSWDQKWGDKGYFYLSYDQAVTYGNNALELMDQELPKENKKVVPQLSAKFEFIKLDGSVMPVKRTSINTRSMTVEDDEKGDYCQYKLIENYPGGTSFKIKFTTNAPAYVYIFSEDDKKVISKLFPYASSISPAINSANATIYLPSESKHARLSQTPGKENICVLYSKHALNFEELLNYISLKKAGVEQAVKDKFATGLIPLDKIKFAERSVDFQADAAEKDIVCFFIELQHN